jgi:nucleotide-binding universal stress UspA family protein
MAGTEGSEQSLRAVEWAAREAALCGGSQRVRSILILPRMMAWGRGAQGQPDVVADAIRESCEQALATAAGRAADVAPGLGVDTALLCRPSALALVDAASDAAMLVVGSRGLAALLLWFSVPSAVCRHSHAMHGGGGGARKR